MLKPAGSRSARFFKTTAVVLLLSCSACLAARTGYAESVHDAVARVEDHYRAMTDLTAKVTQKNHLTSIGRTQTFEGLLLIKKPGKLRLDYTNGQLILIDGNEALFYSRKSEQEVKETFLDFKHMNIPVAFLLGAAHIRDDFDVVRPGPGSSMSLELLPRKRGAAMKKILLRADASGRITELVIHDRFGNVSELDFADMRENTGIPARRFLFTAPKGTEIIER
jgi:outer membrane lipoprotein carrier protein